MRSLNSSGASQQQEPLVVDYAETLKLLERNMGNMESVADLAVAFDCTNQKTDQISYDTDKQQISISASVGTGEEHLDAINSLYRKQLGAIALFERGRLTEPYVPKSYRQGRCWPLTIGGTGLIIGSYAETVAFKGDIYAAIAAPFIAIAGTALLCGGEPRDSWKNVKRDNAIAQLTMFDFMWQPHYPRLITNGEAK